MIGRINRIPQVLAVPIPMAQKILKAILQGSFLACRAAGLAVMGPPALFLQTLAAGQCQEIRVAWCKDAARKFSMPSGPNAERDERRGW